MGVPHAKMTLEEFLAWEELQPERYEFVAGEVFAMVGARRVHGLVAGNIFAALKSRLRGTPCQVFFEGMLVQAADDVGFYPDVFVTCDATDLRTERLFKAPRVVVEVLSPGTESFDRGQKFAYYRGMSSVAEYLLVHPDSRAMELYRRGGDGRFTLFDLTGGSEVEFASIGVTLSPDEVFEGLGPPEVVPAMPRPKG